MDKSTENSYKKIDKTNKNTIKSFNDVQNSFLKQKKAGQIGETELLKYESDLNNFNSSTDILRKQKDLLDELNRDKESGDKQLLKG